MIDDQRAMRQATAAAADRGGRGRRARRGRSLAPQQHPPRAGLVGAVGGEAEERRR